MDKFLVKLLISFSEVQVFVLYPRMLPLIIERGRPEAINIGAAMWGIALDYSYTDRNLWSLVTPTTADEVNLLRESCLLRRRL
jgi:hypothetical protein